MGFNEMTKHCSGRVSELFGNLGSFLRICLFRVLSMGPIPNHLAFIMDGNRRYAKNKNMKEGAGHRAGYLSLISILKYCYELGVKYVTIYAFSIDNFKRRPDEVTDLMDLLVEKTEELLKEESIVQEYGIRVYFIGNLKLLSEHVRIATEKVMKATANNTKCTLLICIAYTSRDEIVHAVGDSCKIKLEEIQPLRFCKASNSGIDEEEDGKKINNVSPNGFQESLKDEADASQATKPSATCNGLIRRVEGGDHKNSTVEFAVQGSYEDKWDEDQPLIANGTGYDVDKREEAQEGYSVIKLVDIEKYLYMAVAPEPDILIRSSGETRLSNFLLWQSSNCLLYSPDALWPEIGLWHLVWAVLNFQCNHSYLEKKKRQL